MLRLRLKFVRRLKLFLLIVVPKMTLLEELILSFFVYNDIFEHYESDINLISLQRTWKIDFYKIIC